MDNKIDIKAIEELQGMKFFIPKYQRGYRWTHQQVEDLLNDIDEFIKNGKNGFYSIQPLVIKQNIIDKIAYCNELKKLNSDENNLFEKTKDLINKYSRWEVIDGQQRLTTIFILLKFLKSQSLYQIEYETRPDSETFLKEINCSNKNDNIDYHHICEAFSKIEQWFKEKDNDFINDFKETLLKNVKFIWYESNDDNPINVFTRLNIGKIPLTNAELIKALFLNKSNFSHNKIKLQQQEIAGEWDYMEYRLQNDEFWLFLNNPGYRNPSRIDFIFDLIYEKNLLKLNEKEITKKANDKTFRYFYAWFNKKQDISTAWTIIKNIFQTFNEWYNDLELYHYIGFLISSFGKNDNVSNILDEWDTYKTKDDFLNDFIKKEIKESLHNSMDLNKIYDTKGNPKTQCRPILLLHNIQTVINQNKSYIKNEKYKLPVFYKFPFHLFKKENWDVEHIDSHTENMLEKGKEQDEWLKATLIAITDEELIDKIQKYLESTDEEKTEEKFRALYEKITHDSGNKLTEDEKNMLWNFTLLDSSTNRSYGNAIFPVKRRIIIGKDQGKKIEIDKDYKIIEKNAIAFVPPCTKNIFTKYYNPYTNNLREWDKTDAENYKTNLKNVLKDFLNE